MPELMASSDRKHLPATSDPNKLATRRTAGTTPAPKMNDKAIARLRTTGSLGLCLAYLLITTGAPVAGVLVNMASQVCLLPFGLKTRSWDLLALSAFFVSVNLKVLLGL